MGRYGRSFALGVNGKQPDFRGGSLPIIDNPHTDSFSLALLRPFYLPGPTTAANNATGLRVFKQIPLQGSVLIIREVAWKKFSK